jgi:monosaccharide-transporting ATPase
VQQLVAIARALDVDSAKVLILDEPTSSLDAGEVERAVPVMRRLRDEGVAILFVSHFLDQVYEISDRITVLRNGKLVGEYPTAELPPVEPGAEDDRPRARRARAPRGGAATPRPPRPSARRAAARGEGLGRKAHRAVRPRRARRARSSAWPGCSAPGRTELARLLFGADRADSGTLEIDGSPVRLRTRAPAIATASRSPPRTARPRASSAT